MLNIFANTRTEQKACPDVGPGRLHRDVSRGNQRAGLVCNLKALLSSTQPDNASLFLKIMHSLWITLLIAVALTIHFQR